MIYSWPLKSYFNGTSLHLGVHSENESFFFFFCISSKCILHNVIILWAILKWKMHESIIMTKHFPMWEYWFRADVGWCRRITKNWNCFRCGKMPPWASRVSCGFDFGVSCCGGSSFQHAQTDTSVERFASPADQTRIIQHNLQPYRTFVNIRYVK